jgi:hypothetical protein
MLTGPPKTLVKKTKKTKICIKYNQTFAIKKKKYNQTLKVHFDNNDVIDHVIMGDEVEALLDLVFDADNLFWLNVDIASDVVEPTIRN